MKCSIFVILIFISSNIFGQIPADLHYVRFLQIGFSDASVNEPLTISTTAIDRKIILERRLTGTQQLKLGNVDVDSLTEKYVVTSDRTNNKVTEFIKRSPWLNPKYHSEEKADTFGTFKIIIDTKTYYFLVATNSKLFFEDMINYLKKEHCDENVIGALNYQIYANTPALPTPTH